MSDDLLIALRESISEGLKSRTLDQCSRWASHRRIMGGDFAGPFGYKYHPWAREIHDSQAEFNTAMKAAQMGITEVAINVAFYMIDVRKKDVLYVLPTEKNASDFAKGRFNVALLYSPYLKQIFTDTNTIALKQAGGVTLYIRGSRGDSNLKSVPVSTLILDELDEMDQKQVWLALERLSGHLEKSVWAISTPTVPKYGIHKLYLQGSQEHYMFQCPHCSKWTELIWPDCMEICGETITDPQVKESYVKCKECQHKLEHENKPDWLAQGQWKATVENDRSHRSWYINQLYSYTVTPREIVLAHFRGFGDEAALCEFHNSKVGKPFIPDGGQVTEAELDSSIANYSKNDPNIRPTTGGQRTTIMGIDQGKLNHVVIAEYFVNEYGYDINAAAFAKVLWEGKVPGDDFSELDRLMRTWQILACVIDADPQTNDARRFARRFPGYIKLCRYRRGQAGKEVSVTEEEDGAPIATVDRTNWLDCTLGRFHSDRIQLPMDVSLEFREHMKNLIRTYEKDENNNPKAAYITTGADHFAHALNYCEIALPFAASIVTSRDVGRFL
jgi:Phage terminase large subunit gpA, ATPase domain